jgi:hypothetical protein
MIASYGPYSASATGGNGFARDFLAGIAAMYSVPSKLSSAANKVEFHYCPRIISNKRQCIKTWERHTDWNGRRHSWASWQSYSRSPFISFTFMDPRFGNVPRSRRLWLQTGRRLGGGFLSAVLAIRILFSDICLGIRRESVVWNEVWVLQRRWQSCVAVFNIKICSIQLLVIEARIVWETQIRCCTRFLLVLMRTDAFI